MLAVTIFIVMSMILSLTHSITLLASSDNCYKATEYGFRFLPVGHIWASLQWSCGTEFSTCLKFSLACWSNGHKDVPKDLVLLLSIVQILFMT